MDLETRLYTPEKELKAKPVLFAEDYNTRFDPVNVRSTDPSRIEGWSETVQANDIAKADALEFRKAHETAKVIKTQEDAYKVIGAGPAELPVDFKWLRISGPGGADSPSANAEIDMYVSQGFLPCTKEIFDIMVENYGYKFNHALWRVAEDGTIRRGYDVALYYRSGDVARKWEQHSVAEAIERDTNPSLPSNFQGDTSWKEEEVEEILITH